MLPPGAPRIELDHPGMRREHVEMSQSTSREEGSSRHAPGAHGLSVAG